MILILENDPSKKLHVNDLKNNTIVIPSEFNASEKELRVLDIYLKNFNTWLFNSDHSDKQSRLLNINSQKFKFFDINDIDILVKLIKIAELAELYDVKRVIASRIAFLFIKNEMK